jgi:hypothetical protein
MGLLIGSPTPQDGKSAYELAVDNGFVGTLQQWLDSLKGEPGAPGAPGSNAGSSTPGMSAYDIWLQNGGSGTQQDFLNSFMPTNVSNWTWPGSTGIISGGAAYMRIGKVYFIQGWFQLDTTSGASLTSIKLPAPVVAEIKVACYNIASGNMRVATIPQTNSDKLQMPYATIDANEIYQLSFFYISS